MADPTIDENSRKDDRTTFRQKLWYYAQIQSAFIVFNMLLVPALAVLLRMTIQPESRGEFLAPMVIIAFAISFIAGILVGTSFYLQNNKISKLPFAMPARFIIYTLYTIGSVLFGISPYLSFFA